MRFSPLLRSCEYQARKEKNQTKPREARTKRRAHHVFRIVYSTPDVHSRSHIRRVFGLGWTDVKLHPKMSVLGPIGEHLLCELIFGSFELCKECFRPSRISELGSNRALRDQLVPGVGSPAL